MALSPSVSVCLSVTNRYSIKRLNIGSRKQNHTIAQGLYSSLLLKTSAKFHRNHPQGVSQGRGQSIMFGGLEPRAWRAREREPITGVWGRSPQRGPGAELLVRGSVCNFRKPQAFVIYLSKTERVVHDGIDNVVYDKKCIKSVNFSYSLTSYKRDTVTQSQKSVILVYSVVSVFTARCYASTVLAMGLCPSVSVTNWCSTKTAKRRITQTKPYDSPGTLVF